MYFAFSPRSYLWNIIARSLPSSPPKYNVFNPNGPLLGDVSPIEKAVALSRMTPLLPLPVPKSYTNTAALIRKWLYSDGCASRTTPWLTWSALLMTRSRESGVHSGPLFSTHRRRATLLLVVNGWNDSVNVQLLITKKRKAILLEEIMGPRSTLEYSCRNWPSSKRSASHNCLEILWMERSV